MGNFLTQAGSDFWNILRKKLNGEDQNKITMPINDQVANPITPSVPARPISEDNSLWDRAKKATMGGLNVITGATHLPFAAAKDEMAYTGNLVNRGLGIVTGHEFPSEFTTGRTAADINAIGQGTGDVMKSLGAVPVNRWTGKSEIKNPAREAINNLTESGGGSFPGSLSALQPEDVFSRELPGRETKGIPVETGGGGDFPGYRPSQFTRDAIKNLNALEEKGDWRDTRNWHGELTAARNMVDKSISADLGMTGGQQNYDVARRNLNKPVAIAGYEGEQHATDLFYPGTDERATFFRGIGPKTQANPEDKLPNAAWLARFKAVNDAYYKSPEIGEDPEIKKRLKVELQSMNDELKSKGKKAPNVNKPSLQQYAQSVKDQGIKATDKEIQDSYNKNYGGR